MLSLSLIIPTHNRAKSLRRALESATGLNYPANLFEIIVVDNAGTDETPEIVRAFQNEGAAFPVRYVREDRLGLHFARHAGCHAARGDVLLFTDDDATFSHEWLMAYGKAFLENEDMAAAGGPVRPSWEVPPPQWVVDYIDVGVEKSGILSLMEPYEEFRKDLQGFFFGVNMAVRRKAAFAVGGFNPESFGDAWLGDGETGLNRKLAQRGLLIGYVPEALVYHHIPPPRLTIAYFRHRWALQGACIAYSEFHEAMPSRLGLCRHVAAQAVRSLRASLAAWRRRRQTDGPSVDAQLWAAFHRARLKYALRLLFDKDLRALVLKEDWLNESGQLNGFPAGAGEQPPRHGGETGSAADPPQETPAEHEVSEPPQSGDSPIRGYISGEETIQAARAQGLPVHDYVEQVLPGMNDLVAATVRRIEEFGVLQHPPQTVCEIGTGTGFFADYVIRACAPTRYESYEPDKGWAAWLAEEYGIVSQQTDGETLSSTADSSIDFVHAHGVFVYVPFLTSIRYFQEIVRVTAAGGHVLFDIISEDCMDDETVANCLREQHRFHCILPREYVKEFFGRHGFEFVGDFLLPWPHGRIHYLIFRKPSP